MFRLSKIIAALCVMAVVGASGSALAQEKVEGNGPDQAATRDVASINVTVPITDEALQRLGVKTLKGTDVVRMATVLSLLGAARTGGGPGGGLNYTCTSETNECVCHGWLD